MSNKFKPIEPFTDYLRRLHPDIVAERHPLIEAAEIIQRWWENGKTGDVLNVSMPTRFGKSLLSTAFSSWLIISDERLRVLRASYAAELAETFSQQVRDQVDRYYERLGLFVMTYGTRARWKITGNPQDNHAGVGIGGGITGFGFDIAIVDDTAKNMLEATSAAYSRQLQVFKESVLLGRLEGRRKILNVGTRWTVNDWFSMWPDAEAYVLPAMIDGRSCCEAWKTTAELELERSRVSDAVWNAQYMQAPTETGRVRLFEGWQPERAKTYGGTLYAVIDPTTDYGKDWFVIGIYSVDRGIVTLVDMFAEKAATPERAAEWLKRWNVDIVFCEANGVGRSVIGKLRDAGIDNVAGFATKTDKYSRAYVQRDDMLNYFRIHEGCNPDAVSELLREADAFPVTGDDIHDDLLDDVVMAFEKLLKI
jgi:hypothetical protein